MIAPNHLERDFSATAPKQKWVTDITEFKAKDGSKVYLSPILDLFNNEIVSYNLSYSPNWAQVEDMLMQAVKGLNKACGVILHSDQGWQYQHQYYHRFLEDKGIQPSMSRKGNSPDNGMMESFFGILKSEMFYGYEKTFHSLEQLEQAIVDYIDYYNNKRIKVKLKHTKISSEEISDGREYSLLFLYVKVEVSCEVVASFGARHRVLKMTSLK